MAFTIVISRLTPKKTISHRHSLLVKETQLASKVKFGARSVSLVRKENDQM